MPITGPQCRAARALVELSREIFAGRCGVDATVVAEFERKISAPSDATIAIMEKTLEDAGAQFIPENGGGVGVRLKFNRSETRRLMNLENEGGPARNDDVP
jgi:transcriptional regulator with XRE-family HTH domain